MSSPEAEAATASAETRSFPSPFASTNDYEWTGSGDCEPPYTLQEIAMQELSYAIRSKPDWQSKRRDATIRQKWKDEALEQQKQTKGESALTSDMVDYVLDELEMHERDLDDPDGIRSSCFDKIYDSDTLVPSDLQTALLAEIAELEDVEEAEKDWHPGSNKQVLDLVHPSLYPLVYGRTLLRKSEGSASDSWSTAQPPYALSEDHFTSKVYQWLPTDFAIDNAGKVKILSYINNLHPERNASAYLVLARLFERFVPLFERTLSDLIQPTKRRIEMHNRYGSWYADDDFDLNADEDEDEAYEKWMETRELTLPEPELFTLRPPRSTPAFQLRGRTVQVIVKLANIHLTPESPNYEGGVWHVEGMQNEEIVASGIYYAAEENISESRLAFRGTFDDTELPYEQGDERGVRVVYGIENEGACVQDYGSLVTNGGRTISFPNLYQHRVSPFSLLDKTKPGYRKIVVFFLVNPFKRIPSTTEVAPQQLEWASAEIFKMNETGALPRRLPPELWDATLEKTPLISLQEAYKIREQLMQERKYMVKQNTDQVFERPFSLCEH